MTTISNETLRGLTDLDARIQPVDNLVRSFRATEAVALRAVDDEAGDGRTLSGHFAVFNQWTEIDSMWEGHFLERIAPGAFTQTFTERRDQIKVLYDHGQDPQLGNKPLGSIVDLREDKIGAYYEVRLIATPYNDEFVIPAAEAGLLGASFRFKVAEETWTDPKGSTKHNPGKFPERTITQVDPLYEFGPVTFPAYSDATAGVRSLTDDYIDRLTHDPLFLARFTERVGLPVVERLLAGLPSDLERTEDLPPTEQPEDEDDEVRPPASPSTYTPTVRQLRTAERRLADREALGAMLTAATIR